MIIQQLDFILNFGTIFKQFKSDDFMEVVGKVLNNAGNVTPDKSVFKLAFYDAEKEQKNKNKVCFN